MYGKWDEEEELFYISNKIPLFLNFTLLENLTFEAIA